MMAQILLFSVGFVCFCHFAVSAMETVGGIMFPGFNDPTAAVNSELEQYVLYTVLAVGILSVPVYLFSGCSHCDVFLPGQC